MKVGRSGSFEVKTDGELLHSKLENARNGQNKCTSHMEVDNLMRKLKPLLEVD